LIVANKVEISAGLKRNLKNGKEYDKLIPSVKCERTNLGEGDTFNTVNWMKAWIEKYSFQTAKLSPKLQGRSLEETVNNIYQFLYDHVQYTADGPLQQLRSPACTWTQRKEGVDCKSYSVFASSILSNLGIKHFIRQIRQAYFYPEEFTHVYIVVPVNQTVSNYQKNTPTYVLDATKHKNTESNYIEKVDEKMVNLKHVGLNAPASESDRTQNIIANFEAFSRHLLQNGIPLSTVNAMREQVSLFTNSGKDPSFKIVDRGIIIEGKLFVLNFINKGLNGEVEGGEIDEGEGDSQVAEYAAAGKKILDMLPPDFLGNTFGSVFANGFDLSCWNASFSESKATAALEVDMPYLVGKFSGLSENPTTETLNRYLNGIEGYILASVNGQNKKYASCTRKGWAIAQKGAEGAKEQVLESINRAFNTTPTGKRQGGLDTSMPSRDGGNFKWGEHGGNAYMYESFSIVSKKANSTYQPTGNSTYQPTGNNNANVTNAPGTSNINTGLIAGGVALAALPFLFMMKKKDVATAVATAKKPVRKTPARKSPVRKTRK